LLRLIKMLSGFGFGFGCNTWRTVPGLIRVGVGVEEVEEP